MFNLNLNNIKNTDISLEKIPEAYETRFKKEELLKFCLLIPIESFLRRSI